MADSGAKSLPVLTDPRGVINSVSGRRGCLVDKVDSMERDLFRLGLKRKPFREKFLFLEWFRKKFPFSRKISLKI
jgi:hypothetical protein